MSDQRILGVPIRHWPIDELLALPWYCRTPEIERAIEAHAVQHGYLRRHGRRLRYTRKYRKEFGW